VRTYTLEDLKRNNPSVKNYQVDILKPTDFLFIIITICDYDNGILIQLIPINFNQVFVIVPIDESHLDSKPLRPILLYPSFFLK